MIKNICIIVVICAVAYLLFRYVAPLMMPFIIAVFLSLLIDPAVNILQARTNMPRSIAVAMSMLVIFGGLGLVIALVMTRMIIELVHFSTYLPQYFAQVKTVTLSLKEKAIDYYFTLPPDVASFLDKQLSTSNYSLDSVLEKAQQITAAIINFVVGFVSAVPFWVILIIISGIATYFMSKDKRVIIGFWLKSIPSPWGRKSLDIIRDVFDSIVAWIRAQAFLISLTFVQTLIGLYIIGAPYALIMALTIGLADLIPILGPGSIYLPWAAWAFITGNSAFAIKLLVLYIIIVAIRQVLETKLVSQSMGMHPLATLMAVYVGLNLLGGIGVIAGPLFLIALKAFASAGVLKWNEK